jgi:Domain of unknown function (DUF4399)
MKSRTTTLASGLGFATLVALGAPVLAAQAKPSAAPAVTVRIVEPSEGDTLFGSSVHVKVEAHGIEIAPAAEHRAGTAHHHLFLDMDLGSLDTAIPAGLPYIIHLGKGQSEYTFEGIVPGPHRLIAVLADPNHVALTPLVVDTVRFTLQRR